ncbi:DUF4397 domain-containing protein [Paenibacillus herberti]|uniref:DUF4397 domain-containing protein n=1 Tax=Paenibacillus herberti TaxID=1619309 RepID=A0A229NXK1_9BACL|nr:DUF4397 domain-containing protein [Paenibacillus herberti]OXM14557.1 hypothetical protein CGZ75_16630 [Paenibacillus herberti]
MDRHPVWTEWQKASQYSMLAGYYRELDPVISLSYATLHQEAMQRLAVLVHMYGYPPEYPSSVPAAYNESAFLGSSFFPTADSFPLPGLEPDSQWVQYGPSAGASWPVSTGPLTPSSWQPIQSYDFFPVASTGSGASFQPLLGRDKDKAEANNSEAASAFIRLLHAAPGQPELELRLEGAYDSLTAAFLKASPYVQAHQGVHRVQLFPEDSVLAEAAKTDAETAFELNLEAGIRYTVAVTADPQDGGLQLLLFADESESQEDRTKVRLLHLATGGPVDVMVRNGGTLFRNVASGSASPYITLSPAQLSLDLTEAGSLRLLHACEPLRLPAASAGTLLYGGTPPKLHLILDS